MPKKQKSHTLTRIRQLDDSIDDLDHLDDMAQDQRMRKQPRDGNQQSSIKQERRQRQKEWGRELSRMQRNRRRNSESKP
jgi:hypothetical protein